MILSEEQNFTYIFILEVIYLSFKLQLHIKVNFLSQKIILKQLPNSSKATYKKPRKRMFWAWKLSR